MIYLGIDPGLTGAVGILDVHGNYLDLFDLPVRIKNTKGKVVKKIDAKALCKNLQRVTDLGSIEVVAAIEAQGLFGKISPSTQASILESYGAIQACLEVESIQYEIVYPISWKSKMGLRKKSKECSTAMAMQLFPAAMLAKAKHHNRAEALLIARHAWMKRQLEDVA